MKARSKISNGFQLKKKELLRLKSLVESFEKIERIIVEECTRRSDSQKVEEIENIFKKFGDEWGL